MNNTLLSLTISILFGIGTFLILRRDLIKVIIGFSIITHATNLFIVASGVFDGKLVPILASGEGKVVENGMIFNDVLDKGNILLSKLGPAIPETTDNFRFVDPLVQALVLTAIVIGLATTAFVLTLAYRIYEEYGTTDVSELRRLKG